MASTSILRGLLQSRASPTSANDGQTGSARTPRLHRQRCIDQWDCSVKEEEEVKNKSQCTKQQQNSIHNIRMEANISQMQFWEHCLEEGTIKQEGIKTTEGLCYVPTRSGSMDSGVSSIENGEWSYQDWIYENVSPSPLSSPCMDKESLYFVGKKNKMESAYSSLESLSPQGFVPNETSFTVNSFDSGYSYDGYQLDESLLTPDPLEFSKLQGGGLSLTDCGGIFENSYNDVNLSLDWLTESIDIPTPDSQDGDVTFSPSPTPYTSFTDVTLPLTDVTPTLPLTPGSSHPPTPLSTSPSSGVDDILSMFSDQASNDSTTYLPPEYLSLGVDNYDSSPSSLTFNSPVLTPLESPCPSFYTPQDYATPSLETSLLVLEESTEDGSQSRKRKASKSSEKVTSKPKRRVSVTAKKERKREQNKTAALRYRQKKKDEKNGCFSHVEQLEAKNSELKKTVNTMTAEIKYLQKLWSEVSATKKQKLEQSLSGIC